MSTTPTTGEEFLETVVRSGLLTADQLRPFVRAGDGPDEHRALANRLIKDRLLAPFQVRQLLAGKTRGYFLGDKYKILALAGTGAKGPVLLCEHLRRQQLVAAKFYQRAADDEAGRLAAALERFVREVLAAPVLDHPNIVKVYDLERAGPVPVVVMDYVDGSSLQQVVAQSGPLPVPRATYYVRQAAIGLRHAHGKGLIHRDIRPGNLLLDRTGVVKLLDLGLAGFLGDLVRSGTVPAGDDTTVGAGEYLSPEQAADGGAPADGRSDIYSLGATLYYLLTGRAPFEGGSLGDKLTGQQFRELIPVRELRPDVPVGLAGVLARMMADEPGDRYQTPVDVITDLGPWARDLVPPPAAAEMPRVPSSAYRLGLVSGPGQSVPREGLLSDTRWGFGFTPGSDAGGSGTYPGGAETRTAGRAAVTGPVTPPPSSIRRPGPAPAPALSSPSAVHRAVTDPVPAAPAPSAVHPVATDPAPLAAVGPVGPLPALPPPTPGRRRRLPSPILLGAVGGAGLMAVAVLLWLSFGGLSGPTLPTTRPAAQAPPRQARGSAEDPPVRPAPKSADPLPLSPPAPTGVQITGSGSTFIKPAMDRWAELYEKQTGVKIKYDGIGSGRGIDNMIDRVLDFGCTDAFMTDRQLDKARGTNGDVLHIPLAMGAVVATYNLPDVTTQLRFTGPVLADIYLGKIRTWNHPAIAASNPGANLPDLAITVIHRADQSGTTAIWTNYLEKASAEWEKKGVVGGGGPTVKWPVGEEGEKNSGVAKAVGRKVGTIGYVELTFALQENLKYARVKNPGDRFVSPSLESVTAAANAALQTIPPDLRYTLTDVPAEDAYPIVGTTWAVLYLNQPGAKGKELVKFLRWAVHDGQEHLKQLNYARLPPRLAKLVDEKLASITAGE